MEILVQIDNGNLIHDVDDGMGVTIRQGTVIFVAIPAVMFRAPYTAVPLNSSIQMGFVGCLDGRPE